MGDIAEMMIDGTLCQFCGTYMGHPVGHPMTCHVCRTLKPKPHECRFCHRGFTTEQARGDHERAVHAKRMAKASPNR